MQTECTLSKFDHAKSFRGFSDIPSYFFYNIDSGKKKKESYHPRARGKETFIGEWEIAGRNRKAERRETAHCDQEVLLWFKIPNFM